MNIRRQEMKSAALYYVVNHMPPGADQMAAATMCFHQAEQWVAQDSSDSARAGFAKVVILSYPLYIYKMLLHDLTEACFQNVVLTSDLIMTKLYSYRSLRFWFENFKILNEPHAHP